MRNFQTYIIFIIFLYSCKQGKRVSDYVKELNTTDSFRYDWPGDSLEKHYKARFEEEYKLPSLEKGFDSIQIRLSYGCVMGNEILLILSNTDKKWSADLTYIKNKYINKEGIIDSVFPLHSNPVPKSGWKSLISKLFALKILSLEDNAMIPNFSYPMLTDGCGVNVEVATKNNYRFYSYDNPDMYSYKYWQAKNILTILRLINEEMDIKTGWPGDEEQDDKKPTTIAVDTSTKTF